jgi:hypothetical protein
VHGDLRTNPAHCGRERQAHDKGGRDGVQWTPCYTPRPYVSNDDDGTDANDEHQLVALSLIVFPKSE